MKSYPRGCRYILVLGGEILPVRKVTQPCKVDDLAWTERNNMDPAIMAVQPRGKLKWYLFVGKRFSMRMVNQGRDPDVMIAKAMLLA